MNELFLKIINMSISASWLVLAVLILRILLKKAPKWVSVLLWGIVAIKLICPFTIESSVSLIPDSVGSGKLISEWADNYIDDIDIYHPDSIYYDAAIGAGREPISDGEGGYYVVTKHDQLGEPATIENTVIPVLSIVWVAGIILLALYTAISYWRLRSKVDTAVRYKDNIYQSENVSSPFVFGIIKPLIYLPFNMNGQDLEHVVAHEQAHIRRKDHWWKPLGFLLLTIHWFNPLMWLAYVLLCRDIELACDEKVIKEFSNEQRADYTQALVTCSVNRRMIAACPLAFGEVGVKERVKSVMNYKKPAFWIVVLAVIFCLGVAVCFLTNPKQDSYMLRIVIPAGSQEEFVYSDEEVSTIKNSIKIWSGDGLGDTEVLLSPVNKTTETGYTATYLTHGMPVEFDAKRDTWFKVGVNMQNPTNEDVIVYVEVENVEVRISEESIPDSVTFEAEILEIHEGYFLVEPVVGSWELNSADKIEIPMKNMSPSPEPVVGDILKIEYDGQLQETYPAKISNPYSISVVEEAETWALIPMVMVNGTLYLDTGYESTIEARCGVMDGEITSQVHGSQRPTIDNQSNFGSGYGYQYGATEGTIEIYMDGEWRIFATEEVRQEIQFPTNEETITYNGKEYKKSELCDATLQWLELTEQERMLSSYFPPEFMIFEETWGIELRVENVTPTGATIKCTQSGGEPTGELQTGGWYILETWTQEQGWIEAPCFAEVGWTQEAWMIPMNDTCEWEVNWEWLYGTLSEGKYRIGKDITDFRGTGDYDNAIYYAEFEITK